MVADISKKRCEAALTVVLPGDAALAVRIVVKFIHDDIVDISIGAIAESKLAKISAVQQRMGASG